MLCLTLSAAGQNLGTTTTSNAFVPNASISVAYIVRAQPAECPIDSYVLLTKAEVTQNNSPFHMDVSTAAAIGGAVLLLWAVAFVLRSVRKTIENMTESET